MVGGLWRIKAVRDGLEFVYISQVTVLSLYTSHRWGLESAIGFDRPWDLSLAHTLICAPESDSL